MNEVKINVKHPSEWEVLSDKELNAMRVVLSMAKKYSLSVAWAEYEIAQAKADMKKAYLNLKSAQAQTPHHSD
ncbi:TPA: hypothetical protein PWU90_000798 [Mannheimia haemolytica]|uniref:hypothetical protein n=1 Tax=Mannheimia haemolytica TaxID=75985 RepID=UPI00077E6A55|nr:hypothetical protein [Mannheimia haemolytica]KYL10075.1 hypothetical protein AC568_04545 [Mannheimia haemolytica]MEE3701285.1 hypothetical protein [Mannheimia haemolytica]UFK41836.1 hypothetical protein LO774_08820 [Mannheimia haemolytica]HDL1112638.1 hypothetical protein [Mannheimia haemolytica]HDL1115079.1 hypothetical protein [Mannheimia haemolytica]